MTNGERAGASSSAPGHDQQVDASGGSIGILPWQVFVSELVGTALLVLVGLSLVILMFGEGSPIAAVLPSEGWRRLITGFLFGTTGALIALSPVGQRSGAHINPIVTLAFRLMGKIDLRTSVGYVVAQLAGAVLGSLPLLAWGGMGRSVAFGATLPGAGYGTGVVLIGEVITTFTMVTLLCVFLVPSRRRCSRSCTRSWCSRSRLSREPARILRAAWDRPSSRDNGTDGGSTGLDR